MDYDYEPVIPEQTSDACDRVETPRPPGAILSWPRHWHLYLLLLALAIAFILVGAGCDKTPSPQLKYVIGPNTVTNTVAEAEPHRAYDEAMQLDYWLSGLHVYFNTNSGEYNIWANGGAHAGPYYDLTQAERERTNWAQRSLHIYLQPNLIPAPSPSEIRVN